jgi:3-deoxy-manno-octulosonate cytidylyltransferase (CMP-KDO synthetase)
MTDFITIIPARLSSTRLPRKPLADLGGEPMVVRVARRAARSGTYRVVVATDSSEVLAACGRHGVEAILTRSDHPTGTDRLAEAAAVLHLPEETIVANVQGDEPLLPPEIVGRVARLLQERPECAIATAAHALNEALEFFNPNVVKVVTDVSGKAMLFSRAPIPWSRDAFAVSREKIPEGLPVWRHVGLYAYRAGFLHRFPELSRAPIEAHESLEQLRALWHGYSIAVLPLAAPFPPGVDTAEDLEHVRRLLAGGELN